MILDPKLANEIYGSAAPDCWNKEWRQVERFGGGMAIELEVGEFLNALVRMTKPEVVVETGTHKGFSALMIAQALKANGKGHLYTADLADYGVMKECEQFGLATFVTFMKGDSSVTISKLAPRVKKIDFLWLDADHSTVSVLKELDAALPFLKGGSLVAFHDIITDPREAQAVLEIRKRFPAWEYINFITARGFALMRVCEVAPISLLSARTEWRGTMNLATVASPSHAASALNLISSYFKNCSSAGRAIFCHFNGLSKNFIDSVLQYYGDRVLFREIPKTCDHAYDPGIWFFKTYALLVAAELNERFLYLDSRVAILKDPVEISARLDEKTRFYIQLPPSPELYNGRWTTRRCLKSMGCDEDRYRNFAQYVAGIQAYVPTEENRRHIEEAYKLMHDYNIGGPSRAVRNPDGPSEMCFEHRGDQSVLSTLIERNGWHQHFEPGIYLKYGDLSTALHYAKGFLDVPSAPPTVVSFRYTALDYIPKELLGIAKTESKL